MRYEEGSYEGEVNEAKNPEGQVGYNRLDSKIKFVPCCVRQESPGGITGKQGCCVFDLDEQACKH